MAAKIKKNTLQIEYSFNFELLGVRTSLKGYKLAWQLNKILNIRLTKQQNLVIHFKKKSIGSYDHYSYRTQVNDLNLFRNKPADDVNPAPALVPEFPHFDYIIMTNGEENLSGKRLQEYLRAIPSVELTTLIPLTALKSKENFIF